MRANLLPARHYSSRWRSARSERNEKKDEINYRVVETWEDWKVETPVLLVWRSARISDQNIHRSCPDYFSFSRVGLHTTYIILLCICFCFFLFAVIMYGCSARTARKNILRNHETNWNSFKMHRKKLFSHLLLFHLCSHFAALMNRT